MYRRNDMYPRDDVFFAFLSQQSTGLVTKRPVTVSEG
ncbi:hypothetical protein JMJ77_0008770, partial [Colletotrichum scovillei]